MSEVPCDDTRLMRSGGDPGDDTAVGRPAVAVCFDDTEYPRCDRLDLTPLLAVRSPRILDLAPDGEATGESGFAGRPLSADMSAALATWGTEGGQVSRASSYTLARLVAPSHSTLRCGNGTAASSSTAILKAGERGEPINRSIGPPGLKASHGNSKETWSCPTTCKKRHARGPRGSCNYCLKLEGTCPLRYSPAPATLCVAVNQAHAWHAGPHEESVSQPTSSASQQALQVTG